MGMSDRCGIILSKKINKCQKKNNNNFSFFLKKITQLVGDVARWQARNGPSGFPWSKPPIRTRFCGPVYFWTTKKSKFPPIVCLETDFGTGRSWDPLSPDKDPSPGSSWWSWRFFRTIHDSPGIRWVWRTSDQVVRRRLDWMPWRERDWPSTTSWKER